jgi:lipopolysaccharide/colanic/teichoic acid biosynthesis glycosyltransferase
MHSQGRETSIQRNASHGWEVAALAVKAVLDRVVAAGLLLALAPALATIALYARISSPGPALVRSRRSGRDGNPFELLRFDLPGPLAELPQIVNVARGDMSLVGPRPTRHGRPVMKPGMTGLAQVHDLTERLPAREAECDQRYFRDWSLGMDLRIIVKTMLRALR